MMTQNDYNQLDVIDVWEVMGTLEAILSNGRGPQSRLLFSREDYASTNLVRSV